MPDAIPANRGTRRACALYAMLTIIPQPKITSAQERLYGPSVYLS